MEFDEPIFYVHKFPPGFPLNDLHETSVRLAQADACIPGYVPPPIGLYSIDALFHEQEADRVKFVLLPDRNIVSRMAQLAQGAKVTTDPQYRTAAGLLALTHCVRMLIEPSVAFHELAHKLGNERAWEELAWFKAADSADPKDMMNIALGRMDTLGNKYRAHDTVPNYDLAKPLMRWNRNYVIALKIVELERLQNVSGLDRVLRLMEWMESSFTFGGPAALTACIYFAPKSPPNKGVFKDKNSQDREAAIAGIRNAAWDLTHLSDFIRRINEHGHEGKTRYLFASLDKNLRRVAKALVECGSDKSNKEDVATVLSEWWGISEAERIGASFWGHYERVEKPSWQTTAPAVPTTIKELIAEGEARVRSFSPRRSIM